MIDDVSIHARDRAKLHGKLTPLPCLIIPLKKEVFQPESVFDENPEQYNPKFLG
jgi:hypothetical protein